jgi:condensin complex subunit 1
MSGTFELQDELQALQDIANYDISNEFDPHSTDPGPLLQRMLSFGAHVSIFTDI